MKAQKQEILAILGGKPVRSRAWPKWPKVTSSIQTELLQALHSGRWAISGPYKGQECFERKFAKEFAHHMGTKYCIPTTSGTHALLLGLLAHDIGPGDEVLVPGLTWVACASIVTSIGAIPILIDVDPNTLIMSLDLAEKAITSKTKAIMLVHLFGSVADLDAYQNLSRRFGIPLIEDCAQAHGTVWKGKCVGTFGSVGCFSMQQSKLLTCGEGGAVITDDPKLAQKMEQLRSDGRLFNSKPAVGKLELIEIGEVQGRNLCMSEFHAAVLLGGLANLNKENAIRQERATLLDDLLKNEGFFPLPHHPHVNFKTYYNYIVQCNLSDFANNSIDSIARALTAELGENANPIYKPLNNHPLYCPLHSPFARDPEMRRALDPKRFKLPIAEYARKTHISIHHSLLLDDEDSMRDIVKAFVKVRDASHNLLVTDQYVSNVAF